MIPVSNRSARNVVTTLTELSRVVGYSLIFKTLCENSNRDQGHWETKL